MWSPTHLELFSTYIYTSLLSLVNRIGYERLWVKTWDRQDQIATILNWSDILSHNIVSQVESKASYNIEGKEMHTGFGWSAFIYEEK